MDGRNFPLNLRIGILINFYAGAIPHLSPVGLAFNLRIVDRCGPAEKPFRILISHIDTSMAHLKSEIVMPVRSVKCITARTSKEGSPGYSWKGKAAGICTIRVASDTPHVFVGHL